MSENNLPNEGMENEEAVIEENTEGQETAETVEEPIAENEEETAEEVESPAETAEEPIDAELLKAKLKSTEASAKKFKTSAVVAWIIAAVLVCTDAYYFMTNIYNKYNHMGYYDLDGYTVGDVVSSMGMDFESFKEMYGLPSDMRKDTNLNAAQSLIKLSKMAELNGIDFETLKERYKFGDSITEESTFGEGIDSMTIKDYLDMSGEDDFETFKTTYNLPESTTEDAAWGTVRKTYEKQKVAERVAKEKEAKQKDNSDDNATDNTTDNTTDTTDTGSDSASDTGADTADNADTNAAE